MSRIAAAVLLCLAVTACGNENKSCSVPTSDGLKADRQKSLFVARVVVTGDARLEQGTTRAGGYLVRTDSVLAGEEPPAEFALWSAQDIGAMKNGTTYVVFGRTSFSGATGPVTADGEPVTAFHVAVSGGVLEVGDGEIARACRGGNGEPVDDEVLAGI